LRLSFSKSFAAMAVFLAQRKSPVELGRASWLYGCGGRRRCVDGFDMRQAMRKAVCFNRSQRFAAAGDELSISKAG